VSGDVRDPAAASTNAAAAMTAKSGQ
jgi:hypothetical protein